MVATTTLNCLSVDNNFWEHSFDYFEVLWYYHAAVK